MRTDPTKVSDPAPVIVSLRKLRGGMEYEKPVPLCPSTTTTTGAPPAFWEPWLKKDSVPIIGVSVGFTRTNCVSHPPPFTKDGNTSESERASPNRDTGSVVHMNSRRSV